MMIHGSRYFGKTDILARIAVLDAENRAYGLSDGRVTERNALITEGLNPILKAERKPYVVYTRLYKKNGDCDKRIHRFATRKAQQSFMWRTVRAVTFYN